MSKLLVILFVSLISYNLNAGILPPLPAGADESAIWNKYCVGARESAEIPQPNYQNADVIAAVKKLAMISPYSFYFYSGPLYSYELKRGKDLVDPPANFPEVSEVKSGRKNAHAFMTLLCGEFRDRPTLIQDKVRWVNRMHTLSDTPQKEINLNKELWSQVSAASYGVYLENSRYIFYMKLQEQRRRGNIALGKYTEDIPVEPFSVCETKFIFKNYVEKGWVFNYQKSNALKVYKKAYASFQKKCSADDLAYIYDFRGDSNFKPNSPESNGMIWYSSTITNNCTRKDGKFVLKDTAKDKVSDPNICEKYFTKPFAYRWSAARAGLATWILRDTKHDEVFSSEGSSVYIMPHLNPMEKPFGFKMPVKANDMDAYMPEHDEDGVYYTWNDNGEKQILTPAEVAVEQAKFDAAKAALDVRIAQSNIIRYDFLKSWEDSKSEFWERSDLGFNQITGLGTKTANRSLAYERLRDAVNRHTDWYSSGYEDGFGISRDQAYSPFVASSYEMSASDGFTSPGVTVNSPADGCKHWMFVFKLKKDQWYNTESIQQRIPVDFNRHWFDETSLGTNRLADSEHAFDRLGTALEGEMDSILYLHNITTGGAVDSKCGAAQMGLE